MLKPDLGKKKWPHTGQSKLAPWEIQILSDSPVCIRLIQPDLYHSNHQRGSKRSDLCFIRGYQGDGKQPVSQKCRRLEAKFQRDVFQCKPHDWRSILSKCRLILYKHTQHGSEKEVARISLARISSCSSLKSAQFTFTFRTWLSCWIL